MFEKTSILIIDDDLDILNLYSDTFLKEGFYKAMGMPTGEDIASIIDQKKPDIILLDTEIEGEDSLDILKKIKKTDSSVLTIMLADEDNRSIAEQALTLGAALYVIKSNPVAEIVKAIKEEAAKPVSAEAAGKMDILVVDDEKEIADMVVNFLKASGYKAVAVTDPKKAFSMIKANKPKLIFLDIVMPGVDGIELLQRIKEVDSNMKVIMMSGVSDEGICTTAVEKGASAYITKPFSLQQVKVTLLSTLTR